MTKRFAEPSYGVFNSILYRGSYTSVEWSGGAMVLRKLPVPGRPTILMIVGQGPIALAVGAGGWGLFGHIFSRLSFLFSFSLSGRRPDID